MTSSDSLRIAIESLARHENVNVRWPIDHELSQHFDHRLCRIAAASEFRFYKVSLNENWWRVEGPPMLVRRSQTDEPLAAFWISDRFHVLDPATGQQHAVNDALASTLRPEGHVFYPSLPTVMTPGRLLRRGWEKSRRDIRRLLLTSIMIVLVTFIVPVATAVIVATAIPDGHPDLLNEMALIVGAAAIGVAGLSAGQSLITIRASAILDAWLQPAIWDRVLRLPTTFFHRFPTGDLAWRLFAVGETRRILTGPVFSSLLSGMFASLSFFLMLYFDAQLAIFGFGFGLVYATTLFVLARSQLAYRRSFFDAEGRATGRMLDVLTGVRDIRMAAAEEHAFAHCAEELSAQQRARVKGGRITVWQSVALTAVPSLGVFGMFWIAGNRLIPIDLAAFAAFNVAFGQFITAMNGLAFALSTSADALPSLDRLTPILDAEPESGQSRVDPGKLTGIIAVREIAFRYDEGPLILDAVSFTVEPGQMVAVVGPSGSGKSTLVRLLLGFEKPQSGAIFYDDRDLEQLDVALVRRQIATVFQNAELYPGTLYQNITGTTALSEAHVMTVLRDVGLSDDVERLPMGLHTMISEGGSTLSSGQRQRVKLAAALARDPQILILDEATSALDAYSEAIVKQNLDRLKLTRLIIAHRLSTIKQADNILVLESGRLVEAGSYDELMARRGAFFRLAERQVVRS